MKGEVEGGFRTYAPKSTVGEGAEPVAAIKEGIAVQRNVNGQCFIVVTGIGAKFYGLAWNVPDAAGDVAVCHGGLRKFYGDGVSAYAYDTPLVCGDGGVLIPYNATDYTPEEVVGYVEVPPFAAGTGEEEDEMGWVRLIGGR